jgi:hypothetical protein
MKRTTRNMNLLFSFYNYRQTTVFVLGKYFLLNHVRYGNFCYVLTLRCFLQCRHIVYQFAERAANWDPNKREEFIDCFIQDNRLADICEMTNLLDLTCTFSYETIFTHSTVYYIYIIFSTKI